MKKLEEMTLEELRVAYSTLKDEKDKADNQVTALTEQNNKYKEDNDKLRHYNNELFAKIPNLQPDKPQEDKTEDTLTYDKLYENIDKAGGLF